MASGTINDQQNLDSFASSVVRFWHNKPRTMLILLVFDILLVCSSIALEIEFLQSQVQDYELLACNLTNKRENHFSSSRVGNNSLRKWHHSIDKLSISVTTIFLVENLSLLCAMQRDFLKDVTHMTGLAVVILSIWLEVYYSETAEGGVFIIIARTWRFVRIGHGLYDAQQLTSAGIESQSPPPVVVKEEEKGDILAAYEVLKKELPQVSEHPEEVLKLTEKQARKQIDLIQMQDPHLLLQLLANTGSCICQEELTPPTGPQQQLAATATQLKKKSVHNTGQTENQYSQNNRQRNRNSKTGKMRKRNKAKGSTGSRT